MRRVTTILLSFNTTYLISSNVKVQHLKLETQYLISHPQCHAPDVTGWGGKGFPLDVPLVSVQLAREWFLKVDIGARGYACAMQVGQVGHVGTILWNIL